MNPSFPAYNSGDFAGNGTPAILWFGPFGGNAATIPLALYSPTKFADHWVWNGMLTDALAMNQGFAAGLVYTYHNLGKEGKYATADIDGDGYGDLVTTSIYGYS